MIRASDADRERTVGVLRDHAAEGRLDPAELEQRVETALSAKTLEELEPLTSDLPGRPPARRRRTRRALRLALPGPLAVTLLLVGIWLASGAGYFWPAWPMIGMAFWAWGGFSCARAPRGRSAHPGVQRQGCARAGQRGGLRYL